MDLPNQADGRGSTRLERLRTHAREAGRGLAHAWMSGSRLLGELVTLSPLAVVIALAALGLWWHEHNQHLRQAGELHQLKSQTEADISQLRSDAVAATKQANQQRAGEIIQLELGRQKSERDQAGLRQRLEELESEEQSKAREAESLSAPEMVNRLTARLELAAGDLATVAPGTAAHQPAGASSAEPAKQAAAGSPPSAETSSNAPGAGRSDASASLAVEQAHSPAPSSTASFALSDAALRKVSGALVSLDNCREQAAIRDKLAADCQAEAATSAAIIEQQKASIAKLNQALADQNQILAKTRQEHQAELKIVRGTFMGRVLRTVEHVAIGVAIGLVIRR